MALPCGEGLLCAWNNFPRWFRWLIEPRDGILFQRGQDRITLFAFLGR
jgi:hypothetical protein